MELFFLFHLFSCTNKQSTIGFNVYCYHDMPFIYNLLSKILTPKPGNCLIFLPKLFPCEGHWSQVPRGACRISILGDIHKLFERGPGEPARGFAAGAGGGQHVLQSSFQPQPLRLSHLVILWLSEISLYPILL